MLEGSPKMHWAALLIACALLVVASAALPTSVAMTQYGPIEGLVLGNGTYRRFQGVPFAAPPLPPLRWKNPRPPGLWGPQPLKCHNFTIGCAQNAHSMDVPTNKSEDCLYLEIYAPMPGRFSEPASVLLWFYGGDWKEGGESFQLYDGAHFAKDLNVVSVITNYRLAALGFLYPESWGDANVGLADQRFALQWIQDNAAHFNADPSKVLIAGQSAGGESVLIHMTSPQLPSARQFIAAVAESGPLSINFKGIQEARVLARTFADNMGCSYSDGACFQSRNTTQVLQAMQKTLVVPLSWSDAIQMWAPVVTGPGTGLEMQPLTAFEQGNVVKTATLVTGSNYGDGVMFAQAIAGHDKLPAYEYTAIVGGIFWNAPPSQIGQILEKYPPLPFVDNVPTFSQLVTDYVFKCSARYALKMMQKAGISNLYSYQFSRVPPACPWPKSQQYCCDKVCHGDEIPYVFHDVSGPTFPWQFPKADLDLASLMSLKWASLSRYGDPNKMASSLTWPAWNNRTYISAQFDTPSSVVQALSGPLCDWWDQIGYWH